MRVEYFPDTDTLSIVLSAGPFEAEGQDTHDPDVTLLLDETNRVAEIVIEHASARIDLSEIRRRYSFEEIRSTEPAAT